MPADPAPVITDPPAELRAQIAVVGSGPGGAITACLLAEAGRDVLLIEEGPFLQLESCRPFTLNEMVQKYRNGGVTAAMGATKVAYVEGRCVGGGSEINSGLYHHVPPDILARWRSEFGLAEANEADLAPHYAANERDLSVSLMPGALPPASLKLHEGAVRLGWKSLEIPRWFKYEPAPGGAGFAGTRQSMSKTFIPRFLAAGGRLLPGTRVDSIRRDGERWTLTARHANTGGQAASGTHSGGNRPGATGGLSASACPAATRAIEISAETLFAAGGAIQTPALLRRSGITRNIGDSLALHPTVKVVARFPEPVNSADMGVPVHQVKEFAPRYSFGCSISSPAYLALALADHADGEKLVARHWRNMAVYYAMTTADAAGDIRCLPGFRDPLVRYHLRESHMADLAEALRKLCELLFAAGAVELYPTLPDGGTLSAARGPETLPAVLPAGRTNLMTIHLFGSTPMGEDRRRCAADSFGRVFDVPALRIADAGLLCTPPGVNPQGGLMAFARRNAMRFLGQTPG